jgi:biotin-(acetyl-CoA carboxylase) ligase
MGINVRMPADARLELAKQNAVVLADLREMTDRTLPSRNDVIVAVLTELAKVLPVFSQQGLAPFRGDWERFDAIAYSPVKVFTQAATVLGQARGISNDGALLVVVDGRLQEFVSGEVSVRTAPLAKG